ncbi:phosphatase 1 regulatory subunit 7-like [Brachionus plicatilis]|uniref:Phosphatase 1 regulatory subunit 7-like n=1 Tax=Brachionus plicatilis TaxID=10195 RepID=A0A3M7PCW2_BRAPC|nr:phosphatase 1 regulatory subunit 7-like [Brachionus plicatilis]
MSEFTNLRLKKNAKIAETLSNFSKKDLYSWKNVGSLTRSNARPIQSSSNNNLNQLTSPSFPTAPPSKLKSLDSNFVIKRTNSLKDLQQSNLRAKIIPRANTAKTRLKRLDLNRDQDDNSNKRTEFLTSFNSSQIAEKDLEIISDRPYLNSARGNYIKKFDRNSNTESVLKDLMKQDCLYMTEIDLSQLNIESIVNVEKFKFLKILDLSCNKIKKIENLNFKSLNELRLYANQIEIIENLEQLIELQSLELQSNRIKKIGNSLSKLKKLEFLRLDQNNLNAIKSSELTFCSNLIYLNVSCNNLESIGFINCLPNLEEFYATNLKLQNLNDLDSSRIKHLIELDLSNNSLSDQTLSCLKDIKTLLTLKVANNGLKSIKCISIIGSLKNLDIASNLIDNLADISQLDRLEVLNVSSNQIQNSDQIILLDELKELVELNLKNNPVLDENCSREVILDYLPRLTMLNDIPTDSLSTNSDIKSDKNKLDLKFIELDLVKFNQQMDLLSEAFMKQYNESKQYLDTIDTKKSNQTQSSISRFSSATAKQLPKKKLMDALYYSKQLGNNPEPECKTF